MEEQNREVQIMKAEVMNLEDYAMGPESIIKQVAIIQTVMNRVMQKDQHYGIIPGCGDKPTLLKPGAEKLTMTFRLAPKFHVTERDLGKGHREYEVKTELISIVTGGFIGEGLGSCSTMESKYRFRNAEPELTDKPVPKKYWDLRKAGKAEAQKMLGGKGFVPKKNDAGQWVIAKHTGERVEHDNPADYYNTCLKIAKKRSIVDATLTATAASDIFTQDIEDLPQDFLNQNSAQKQPEPKETKKPTMDFPGVRSELKLLSGSGKAWNTILSSMNITSYADIKNDAKKKKQLWDRVNIELNKLKKAGPATIHTGKDIPCPELDGKMVAEVDCDICDTKGDCPNHAMTENP